MRPSALFRVQPTARTGASSDATKEVVQLGTPSGWLWAVQY